MTSRWRCRAAGLSSSTIVLVLGLGLPVDAGENPARLCKNYCEIPNVQIPPKPELPHPRRPEQPSVSVVLPPRPDTWPVETAASAESGSDERPIPDPMFNSIPRISIPVPTDPVKPPLPVSLVPQPAEAPPVAPAALPAPAEPQPAVPSAADAAPPPAPESPEVPEPLPSVSVTPEPARNPTPLRLVMEPSSTSHSPTGSSRNSWLFAIAVLLAIGGGAVLQGKRDQSGAAA
jgi:hypothetical protein